MLLLAATAATAAADDFWVALHDYTGEYARPWAVTRFHTFVVGKKCLARFTDKDQAVIGSAAQVATHVVDWAKKVGADDWSTIERQRNNDPETNHKLVYDLMEAFRPRLSITVKVDGEDCDAGNHALWLQYWTQIAYLLEQYPPRQKRVAIVLEVTPKTKVVTASVAKDGTFLFTASRDIEPNNWIEPMEAAFRRAALR